MHRSYKVAKLDTIIDTHGNLLDIDYRVYLGERDSYKESYPTSIRYTTNSSTTPADNQAEYEIQFEVSAKGFDSQYDKRVAETAYKLDTVKVCAMSGSNCELIHKYDLYVNVNTATKVSWLEAITQCADLACDQSLPPTTFEYDFLEIGWAEDLEPEEQGWVVRDEVDNPFLESVDNGYGGLVSFDYGQWCLSTPDDPDPPFDELELDAGCGEDEWWTKRQWVVTRTLDPGVGPEQRVSHVYSDPGYRWDHDDEQPFRSFIGFGQVTADAPNATGDVRRQTTTTFSNTMYYDSGEGVYQGKLTDPLRGRVLETLSTDEPFGRPSIKTSYDYETYLETGWPDEVYFVYTRAITETDCGIDVGNHSNCATKWTEYYYDDYYQRVGGLGQTPAQYGNLTRILEYGAPDDLLRTTVRFYPINETCHIAGVYCVDHVYDGAENNDNLVASTWYAYDGAGYCGQPGSEGELTRMRQVLTVTPEVSGRKYTTQDTAYQYDDYGHVTATVVYAEAGETVISGSQVVSDSPASGDPRTSTTAYDPDHPAFAISTTNPAGHQVTTAYYGVNGPGLESQGAFFGLPSSATDANGITTYYYYDEFGRTSKIVRPGDSYSDPTTKYAYYEDVEERDLNWGSGPRAVVAMEQKTAEGQPNVWSRKLYDGLGRLIQSQTPAGDWVSLGGGSTSGHDVIQNVAYDALGQVISESLPYSVTAYAFTGSPPATPWKTPDWSQPQTTYQYDGLGQVKVITGPDGEIIRHYYGYTSTHHLWGWYESVYDQNDYAHRYKKDALGRLVVVDEYDVANPDRHTTPYGTTEYEHDAAGNLLKVTDAAANDTTMEYDLAGRKIEMVDPDMGTWYYGYDVLGNLFYQIDAERQATHFYYDELDRLTGKIYDFGPVTVAGYERPAPPPFEQQYDVLFWYDEYGTGDYGESVGQRVCMLDGSGWTEYYYDDDRGRLTAQVKEIGGAVQGPFVTQWAYDAVDRVVSMTYPDGEVVTSTYDAQGLPDSLVGDSSYVTDASYNALGQAKQIDTGNGASTTYTYYGESGAPSPTDRSFRLWQARTTVDTTDHLWLEYDYGPAGNVTEIVDKTNSNQEQTFAYDALDRLVSASTDTNGQGQYSRTYTYNAIGNLVSKAGVTYTYPTTRPHAVETTTAGGSFQYDDNGNMVSRTISGTTYTQTWTVENRLESATDTATGHAVSYSYDGDGVLVKKETVSDTTYYAGDHFEIKVVGASGPAAPTDLSAFYTVDNQISPPQCDAHLFWQPSFPLAGVTFNLFRHTTAYVPLDAAHRLASGLTSASYTDEDVEYDYYYVATAVDSIGESGPSIAYQISTPCSSQGTSSAPFGESAPGGEDAALEADARSRPAPYDACLASPDKEGCRDRLTIRPMSKADTWRLDEPEPETYASDKAGAIVRPRGTEEEAGTLTVLIDQGIDGGFENDAAGWTAVPSTDFPATSFYHDSQDSASPYSGQYAYALSNQAYGYLLSDPINVSASTAYSLTAYVRGELDAEGTYGGWIVRAYFYDGSDGELGYEDMAGGTTPAASWTEVGDALATPAGTAKLRVALFNHLGSGWVAYDDVSLVPTSGGANMVSNAGFEGSGSWSEVGHAAFPATSFWLAGAKTAAPHSGDYAYALSNQAFGYLQSDHIDVIGGDDYKLKAWVRGELDPDDSHNKWYIRARFHDSNGDYISYDNAAKGAAGTLTTSWQQKGGTVSAPANAATMRIRLMNYTNSGWAAFDDLTLTNDSGGGDPVVVNPGFEGTSGWNEVAKPAFPATSMVRDAADIADGHTGDHAYAISNHAHGYLETDEMAVDYGAEYHLQAAIRGVLDADDSHGGWRLRVAYYGVQGLISEEEVASGTAGSLGTTWQVVSDTLTTPPDATDLRVRLVTEGMTGWLAWDEVSLTPVFEDTVTQYYYLGGRRVAMRQGDAVYYLLGDHLGSTSLMLNAGGGKVSESRYYPYGEERWSDGTLSTDYRFTGQRLDSYTQLTVMGVRHYDPALGRWTSADTLVPDHADPQSLNRYSYVFNRPLQFIDPSGHEGLPPEIEELVKANAEIYEVPWQVLAGLLESEIELDTQWKDFLETWFMRLVPPGAWTGNYYVRVVLDSALAWKPNPGPGIGNVHVNTARFVSEYFATSYGDNSAMQLNLHGKSTEQVGFLLAWDPLNVQTVAAYTRLLADYRFGAEENPSQTSHADLPNWTTTDAVAVWHGYRYGVRLASPRGEGRGFDTEDFQRRDLSLDMTVDLAMGNDKRVSMYGSLPYFEYYFGQ